MLFYPYRKPEGTTYPPMGIVSEPLNSVLAITTGVLNMQTVPE
jgi:hypothetical protein